MGATHFLPRRVLPDIATKMLVTVRACFACCAFDLQWGCMQGEVVKGKRALELGLVTEVCTCFPVT